MRLAPADRSGQPAARRWWRRLRPPRRLSFTREGRLIVILSVGVGFAAINTGNNLLYLLLGWLLSFIIASGILSEMTLQRLTVERRPPPRVFAGEPFLMEVVIRNDKPTRASYSIEVEDLVGATPLDKRCYFLKIPAAKSQRTSYRHTFVRRGLYTLTGYRVATKFPFALFRKSRDVDAPLEVLVYPARVMVPRPAPRTEARGEATANRTGRRGDFFGLREHRAGDDRRDVHWRSSARTGRLLVREYEDEHARRVAIAVDNALPDAVRDAAADGAITPEVEAQVASVERAISVAASLAAVYLEAGWTIELCARGCRIPPGAGRNQEARIARALALLPYAPLELAFAELPPRVDSVLVVPRAVAAPGRPRAATVREV
ncbi:MAG TPA: DUF58 domain-containing protein [Kofleriaceae bacterium]|jgi:uncharacterized protein (DUF58 family)|nr:DUF58 domain-containing protein [Kofleriaceae bacterium]